MIRWLKKIFSRVLRPKKGPEVEAIEFYQDLIFDEDQNPSGLLLLEEEICGKHHG